MQRPVTVLPRKRSGKYLNEIMERITSRFQSIPLYVPHYGISVVIGLDEPRYRRQKGRQYTRRYMEPDGHLSNYPRPRAVALSGGVTALRMAPNTLVPDVSERRSPLAALPVC